MYNCLYYIINYYLNSNTYMIEDINQNKKKWYFKNGTVVTAETITFAELKIINTCLNTKNYYSSELDNEIWEVQFSTDIFPDVYVIVNAKNGKIAAENAIKCLNEDKDSLEIIEKYKYIYY